MRYQESNEILNKKADEIVAALGNGWEHNVNHPSLCYIVNHALKINLFLDLYCSVKWTENYDRVRVGAHSYTDPKVEGRYVSTSGEGFETFTAFKLTCPIGEAHIKISKLVEKILPAVQQYDQQKIWRQQAQEAEQTMKSRFEEAGKSQNLQYRNGWLNISGVSHLQIHSQGVSFDFSSKDAEFVAEILAVIQNHKENTQ